ncbi:4-alpha-glucanotransferase [Antarcticibacterium arcticum]|nr:4-alpha-glucanotransferase [Antarcticibacterium arcticum]
MDLKRSSGILLHVTSLPSPFGIGDMGPEAYEFIDFLEASAIKYWQVLPLNPTDDAYSHSPYSSYSAFAGNTLLISPEFLEKEGFINLQDFNIPEVSQQDKVNFKQVSLFKEEILEAAYHNFKRNKINLQKFKTFVKTHRDWLEDYSLFKVLHDTYNTPWFTWPVPYRDRTAEGLKQGRKEFKSAIERVKFNQFLFFSQWLPLRSYAQQNQIQIIGDIPIYVNHDSADCWTNSRYFKLNKSKFPSKISGVPPDYFSETGQLWGTPVYNWKELKANRFDWWIQRIKQNLLLFDVVRLDHFRGFSAYWEVPAGDKTAQNGKWVKAPGHDFFKTLQKEIPHMPFIAEDLGSLDQGVYDLIADFNFPGMNVLLFAFGDDKAKNPYLPFNHIPHSIVYTGTHDNNTVLGWYEGADSRTKRHLKEYTGKNITSKNVNTQLHRMALASVSKLAIIPMQDILGLGSEAVMNIPGSTKGNWTWRLTYDQLSIQKVVELKVLNELFGRG